MQRQYGIQNTVDPDGFLDRAKQVNISMFKENRDKLVRLMIADNIIGTIFMQGGKDSHIYDTDCDNLFNQESFFTYLFGINEPNCYGAIKIVDTYEYQTILFIPKLDANIAIWMGKIKSTDFYKEKYGVDVVYYTNEIASVLKSTITEFNINGKQQLYINKGTNSNSGRGTTPTMFEGIEQFDLNTDVVYGKLCECRVIKTQKELELLRFVNKISSEAHIHVMKQVKFCKQESDLESEFLYYINRFYGCRYLSYTCVCCSGFNGAILHYGHAGAPNDRMFDKTTSEMLLLDMGAEYFGYDSDITCSFPTNGKFTEQQKQIYNIVLASQRAVESSVKAGAKWSDLQSLSKIIIVDGLVAMGMIVPNGKTSEQLVLEDKIADLFMPHSFGHLMGLDVHDVDNVENPVYFKKDKSILRTGMVITVEPGIYFIEELLLPALEDQQKVSFLNKDLIMQFINFGGVRLEDDVIVLDQGCENITKVPREIDEIEKLINDASYNEITMCKMCTK